MPPRLTKQRARTADEKEIRKTHLLDAASKLFATAPYEAVTMAEVAHAAGIAKASAYGYFASKETLFLELSARELSAWLTELERPSGRARPIRKQRPRSLAQTLAGSLARRPLLVRLLALMHSTLQNNVAPEELLAFKLFLVNLLNRAGTAVQAMAGELPLGWGTRLILVTYVLVIGFGQLANPPASVREVVDSDARLHVFKIDFEHELAATLESIVTGWFAATPN
jgi:AcrR family transcriptional regulator